MANAREILGRMKSVQDTRKITNAMYLISSTKLKKSKKLLEETEPYFYTLQDLIRRILRHMPEVEHFYFNPTLSPFKVPFILSVFLTGIWLFIIVTLAVLDDLFRQLTPAAAVFYLLGLMSCCIFCYFFFILTTHIYIGYFFLACFIWLFVKKVRRGSGYKYRCGNCGQKLREKGQCPHCGAVNE